LAIFLAITTALHCYEAAQASGRGAHFHGNGLAHKAVLNLNTEKLQSLITTNDPSITAFNNAGEKPLHTAARTGNFSALTLLLENLPEDEIFSQAEQSYQKERPAREKNTAAHIATAENNDQCLNLFLERYPLPTLTTANAHGNTILHIAAREGSFHCFIKIIQAAEKLAKSESDFDFVNFINIQNSNGLTALNMACREGKARIVVGLIGKDADLSLTNSKGITPLALAQRRLRKIRGEREHTATQYRTIIRILKRSLKRVKSSEGIVEEVDDEDDEGSTEEDGDANQDLHDDYDDDEEPFVFVKEVEQKTPSAGKKTASSTNARQTTALHIYAQNGSGDATAKLLETPDGVDQINIQDSNGRTPLHFAAMGHKERIVKLLIKAGADVNALDDNGKTPLQLIGTRSTSNTPKKFDETQRALKNAGAR
jgi:ankyrin repeat protein